MKNEDGSKAWFEKAKKNGVESLDGLSGLNAFDFPGKPPLSKKEKEAEAVRSEAAKKEDEKRLKEKISEIKMQHPGWGKKAIKAIADGKVFIGMSEEQVIESWGRPDNINSTISQWGTNQQWCYEHQYLYFSNGKLDSMQTFGR